MVDQNPSNSVDQNPLDQNQVQLRVEELVPVLFLHMINNFKNTHIEDSDLIDDVDAILDTFTNTTLFYESLANLLSHAAISLGAQDASKLEEEINELLNDETEFMNIRNDNTLTYEQKIEKFQELMDAKKEKLIKLKDKFPGVSVKLDINSDKVNLQDRYVEIIENFYFPTSFFSLQLDNTQEKIKANNPNLLQEFNDIFIHKLGQEEMIISDFHEFLTFSSASVQQELFKYLESPEDFFENMSDFYQRWLDIPTVDALHPLILSEYKGKENKIKQYLRSQLIKLKSLMDFFNISTEKTPNIQNTDVSSNTNNETIEISANSKVQTNTAEHTYEYPIDPSLSSINNLYLAVSKILNPQDNKLNKTKIKMLNSIFKSLGINDIAEIAQIKDNKVIVNLTPLISQKLKSLGIISQQEVPQERAIMQ